MADEKPRPVQTRSERNGIAHHETLKDAFRAANYDPTIWKVSFPLQTGERVRLVKITDDDGAGWIFEPIMEFT